MRAKFGGDPTAGSKNLPFKFNNRWRHFVRKSSAKMSVIASPGIKVTFDSKIAENCHTF